jgi:DNA-binding transcriptional LysR family regulator
VIPVNGQVPGAGGRLPASRPVVVSRSPSQHIRLLERMVGTELLVREQSGVKLTPRGGESVDRARS